MSLTSCNSLLSSATHALNINIVLERVLLYSDQDKENPNDVIKHRLVNHLWNNTIVRIVKKSKQSFQIPLQYGLNLRNGRYINQTDGERWAKEILEEIMSILMSNTATPLPFDTVVVDRDFSLRGLMPQWSQFLEIYGHSIRHLKFGYPYTKFRENFDITVMKGTQHVPTESFVAALFAAPNLESLDFCFPYRISKDPFFPLPLPRFQKLTNIRIREPWEAYYSPQFIKQILVMAPNLTTLHFRPFKAFYKFADAIKTVEPTLKRSLTNLSIDHADVQDYSRSEKRVTMTFPYLNLTTLELNDILGNAYSSWLKLILESHHYTLRKLILGDEENRASREYIPPLFPILPSVMENLRVLEVNLSKFKLHYLELDRSYGLRFPVLETLVFKGYGGHGIDGNEWTHKHIKYLLPGDTKKSQTVKEFILRGQIYNNVDGRESMSRDVSSTFPSAIHHI